MTCLNLGFRLFRKSGARKSRDFRVVVLLLQRPDKDRKNCTARFLIRSKGAKLSRTCLYRISQRRGGTVPLPFAGFVEAYAPVLRLELLSSFNLIHQESPYNER